MNNLHRERAPISDAAWAGIEDEARRTFLRNLAGRRAVDVVGPAGLELAAVGTGHIRPLEQPKVRPETVAWTPSTPNASPTPTPAKKRKKHHNRP